MAWRSCGRLVCAKARNVAESSSNSGLWVERHTDDQRGAKLDKTAMLPFSWHSVLAICSASPNRLSGKRSANSPKTKAREDSAEIARAAASLVSAGDVIGFNGGTTTSEAARALAARGDLDDRRVDQPLHRRLVIGVDGAAGQPWPDPGDSLACARSQIGR